MSKEPKIRPGLYSIYLYYFWGCKITQEGKVIKIYRPDLAYVYDKYVLGETKWLDYE